MSVGLGECILGLGVGAYSMARTGRHILGLGMGILF